ncbi:hypothetical protein KBY86_08610 [Synechococcus sp. Lug-A]|uniref:hypothetical protein n=1 Tax=Synechococcus sp. Lug-A TaxID=2823740 RepID=UPI0020CDF034|nr:hypothetical protein [Synechococcus sp. Lug-A]MCP9846943.1 hypothetical protein [Synechococcus sp. Lug-A]
MLAGFSGNSGTWIDMIQGICAEANANRTFRQPMVEGTAFGGRGGAREDIYCPIGAVLSGIDMILTTNDRQVASLALNCSMPGNGQSAGLLYFGNKDYRPQASGEGIGSFARAGSIKQQCPGGELPTGFTVNFGAHVNAFGLICDRIAYPVAVVPSPPLKTTGHMPPPSPSPAVASDYAFAGGWQTVTGQNGHFTLILQIPNPNPRSIVDLDVIGQFINTDGATQYNGTLRGTIRRGSRTLQYTYSQPGMDSGGSGYFHLTQDGSSIEGVGKAGDTEFTWKGTRAK